MLRQVKLGLFRFISKNNFILFFMRILCYIVLFHIYQKHTPLTLPCPGLYETFHQVLLCKLGSSDYHCWGARPFLWWPLKAVSLQMPPFCQGTKIHVLCLFGLIFAWQFWSFDTEPLLYLLFFLGFNNCSLKWWFTLRTITVEKGVLKTLQI